MLKDRLLKDGYLWVYMPKRSKKYFWVTKCKAEGLDGINPIFNDEDIFEEKALEVGESFDGIRGIIMPIELLGALD